MKRAAHPPRCPFSLSEPGVPLRPATGREIYKTTTLVPTFTRS